MKPIHYGTAITRFIRLYSLFLHAGLFFVVKRLSLHILFYVLSYRKVLSIIMQNSLYGIRYYVMILKKEVKKQKNKNEALSGNSHLERWHSASWEKQP